jgi:hypothetical protein
MIDIDWTKEPDYTFTDEVAALMALQDLAYELDAARKQLEHCMRYMTAAVQAAGRVRENGKPISKSAIIRESGLARQTVYDMLPTDEV